MILAVCTIAFLTKVNAVQYNFRFLKRLMSLIRKTVSDREIMCFKGHHDVSKTYQDITQTMYGDTATYRLAPFF